MTNSERTNVIRNKELEAAHHDLFFMSKDIDMVIYRFFMTQDDELMMVATQASVHQFLKDI
jgi:hypothetical protein